MGPLGRRLIFLAMTVAAPCLARPAGGVENVVPFRLLEGWRIVVAGLVEGANDLSMMIDTGADCSLVDPRVVKRLGLPVLSERVRFNALGRTGVARRAILRGLRLGPILTTLPCLVADIPFGKIDAIIGLDLLRRYSFTLDFEARKLVFGPPDSAEISLPFDPALSLVVVPMDLNGEILRVMIDTGADCLYLFAGRVSRWMMAISTRSSLVSSRVGGKSETRALNLESARMGPAVWKNIQALIVDALKAPGCDGALSPIQLRIKRISFDFARGLLSFDR